MTRYGLLAVVSWLLLAGGAGWAGTGAAPATEAAASPPGAAERMARNARRAGLDPAVLAQIAPRMESFVEAEQAAGVVTLIVKRGQVVHLAAVGQADIETQRPMTPRTLFSIASMTKPITATALMILHDEGKLSPDDPVSKYLPEFKQAALKDGPPQREITLRDLMTHTSGVVGSQANEGTLAETVSKMAQRPLGFHPGEKWQYSPGLSVCGRVVEVVAEQPFEQFLAERIFQPLGMVDTTFVPSAQQQRRLAKIYQPGAEGKGLAPTTPNWISALTPDRTPNPSGGLFSTARDLSRFYAMLLAGGEYKGQRIISAASIAKMTRIHTGDLATGFVPGNGWGLGWCVVRDPQGVTETLSPGTYGHGGAFGTQAWLDPHRDVALVMLVQRSGFGNGDASELRAEFQRLALAAEKSAADK